VLEDGADALAMAELADACRLRDAGITAPILLYPGGLATAEGGALMQRQNIVPQADLQFYPCSLSSASRSSAFPWSR
jgi:alanine racemase